MSETAEPQTEGTEDVAEGTPAEETETGDAEGDGAE